MYFLKSEAHFDSAHFLSGYEGKCSNIHGHRWIIKATIYSEKLITDGQMRNMIVDFGVFRKDLNNIADNFDHSLIIEKNTLKPRTLECLKEENFRIIEIDARPTAETFSKLFYDMLVEKGYAVKSVSVYETPQNCAVYESELM